MVNFEEEEGIRRRYLYCFQQLQAREEITREVFLNTLEYDTKSIIRDLEDGRVKISLQLIFDAARLYPEFDMQYILFSPDMPEVNIPKLKPGRRAAPKPAKKAIGRPRSNPS